MNSWPCISTNKIIFKVRELWDSIDQNQEITQIHCSGDCNLYKAEYLEVSGNIYYSQVERLTAVIVQLVERISLGHGDSQSVKAADFKVIKTAL